jgi:hypothetical protein
MGPLVPFSTRLCGNLGRLQTSNSSHGWPFKIGYGWRTFLKNVVGTIVVFAPFASKLKRWRHTYFSNVASPKCFGDDKGTASSIQLFGPQIYPYLICGIASTVLLSYIKSETRL